VFLHPEQRHAVERNFSGPALVKGAAGTGKSVVALHRAARLMERAPRARVFLTSFSRTLAAALERNARVLLGTTGLTVSFLRSEWAAVIDPWNVTSWEAYRAAPRAGRGIALGGRQRMELWRVFERVQAELESRGQMTWGRLCYRVAADLNNAPPPFDHIVADECQDLGPAELHLLRAMVAPGENDILLAGDAGQQIYRRHFSWPAAGMDIRGRSIQLRVNYRTTGAIRLFADQIVTEQQVSGSRPTGGGANDADSPSVEPRHSISLLSGPDPDVVGTDSPADEAEVLATWLDELLADGFQPADIGIFARTKNLLTERAQPALHRLGRPAHELSDDNPLSGGRHLNRDDASGQGPGVQRSGRRRLRPRRFAAQKRPTEPRRPSRQGRRDRARAAPALRRVHSSAAPATRLMERPADTVSWARTCLRETPLRAGM
jgi:superfamily I DNA/RNA helicase